MSGIHTYIERTICLDVKKIATVHVCSNIYAYAPLPRRLMKIYTEYLITKFILIWKANVLFNPCHLNAMRGIVRMLCNL